MPFLKVGLDLCEASSFGNLFKSEANRCTNDNAREKPNYEWQGQEDYDEECDGAARFPLEKTSSKHFTN